MNKRVYFAWAIIIPPILLVTFLLFHNYIENITIRNTYFYIMWSLYLIWPFYTIAVTPFLCSPKSELPDNINLISFNNDIICEQLDRNNFIIYLYDSKLKIDMSGWIFKKTYIRDIILMYYHLNHYNKNKLKSTKCLSKKFFPNQNLSIIFMSNNGEKKLYLIKDGKEKRSFLCSYKIFALAAPLVRRGRWKKDRYIKNEVFNFYM